MVQTSSISKKSLAEIIVFFNGLTNLLMVLPIMGFISVWFFSIFNVIDGTLHLTVGGICIACSFLYSFHFNRFSCHSEYQGKKTLRLWGMAFLHYFLILIMLPMFLIPINFGKPSMKILCLLPIIIPLTVSLTGFYINEG